MAICPVPAGDLHFLAGRVPSCADGTERPFGASSAFEWASGDATHGCAFVCWLFDFAAEDGAENFSKTPEAKLLEKLMGTQMCSWILGGHQRMCGRYSTNWAGWRFPSGWTQTAWSQRIFCDPWIPRTGPSFQDVCTDTSSSKGVPNERRKSGCPATPLT